MSSLQTRDTVHRELKSGPLTNALLDTYELAARGEIPDRRGRRWVTLTDYEAAKILGCERSSVCSCRHRLVEEGIVKEHYRRLCRHRPSQNRVSAWGLSSVNPTSDELDHTRMRDETRRVMERRASELNAQTALF